MIKTLKTPSEHTSSFKYVNCTVGGSDVKLLIDLGARVSVLNHDFLNMLEWQPVVKRSSTRLTTYTGGIITTIGEVQLPVRYDSISFENFTFHVVRSGDSLMGVDLFDALGFRILDHRSCTIAHISSNSSDSSIKQRFPVLIQYDPTKKIKDFRHMPEINTNIPFFRQKLRRLPQSMVDPVCKILKQMVADGIL